VKIPTASSTTDYLASLVTAFSEPSVCKAFRNGFSYSGVAKSFSHDDLFQNSLYYIYI